jgi:LysM repeat protein
MRERATQKGFDPNKWFGNVELITADIVGREPVDYVANINKYYISYKLLYEARVARKAAREKIGGVEADDDLLDTLESADKANPAKVSPPFHVAPSPTTEEPKQYKPKYSLKASTKKTDAKPAARYHVVSSADTLYTIGERYGVSVEELIRINKLGAKGIINPGQKLRITP